MSKYETFSVEIPVNDTEAMDEFNKAMDEYHDEMMKNIQEEADSLGISFGAMTDIFYLRTRSRWTQEKENHLIDLARKCEKLPDVLSGEF